MFEPTHKYTRFLRHSERRHDHAFCHLTSYCRYHFRYLVIRFRFVRARSRQRTCASVVMMTCDHKLICREACDDLMSSLSNHDFLFDTCCAPAICRWPVGFKRKHHTGIDFKWMIERNESADYRLLPNGQSDTMTILQSETRLFICKTKFFSFWPDGGDLTCCAPRTDKLNRGI